MENEDFLAEELDIMIRNLVLYRKALEERNEKTLAALLEKGSSQGKTGNHLIKNEAFSWQS